jgi:DNA-binding NarL/FixJ family response regulator
MSGLSVLIVDDHEGFRGMARELLAGRGFNVVGEAADGRNALGAAARLRPAVVLLDVQLPDMDGFEVTRLLRAWSDPPDVVLVSTREATDYGQRIPTSGALGFITKSSLSADTLLAILRRHVEETQ